MDNGTFKMKSPGTLINNPRCTFCSEVWYLPLVSLFNLGVIVVLKPIMKQPLPHQFHATSENKMLKWPLLSGDIEHKFYSEIAFNC